MPPCPGMGLEHSLRFFWRDPMLRHLTLAAALVSLALATSACNTVKGLGEDISSVGNAGEEVLD